MDWEVLRNWYRHFPRQFSLYRIWVHSFEELKRYLEERQNEDLYVSVFSFPEEKLDKPLLNKLVFDFDLDKKSLDYKDRESLEKKLESVYEEVKRLCEHFEERSLKTHVFFTGGRGFHVYLFFKNPVKLKKNAIRDYVLKLQKKLQLEHLDAKITYDFSRIIRVPFSRHSKSGRRCVPVDLSMTISEILDLSESSLVFPLKVVESSASSLLLDIEEIANEEIEVASNGNSNLKFEGKYLNLPCVNALFGNKLPPGNRWSTASKIIAIAYYLDHNGSMEGFEEVVKEFVRRQNVDHPLKLKEVLGWKRGVYRLKGPEWNCKEVVKYLRRCGISINCRKCPLYQEKKKLEEQKRKDEMKSLVEKLKEVSILDEVKKYLDKKVVGEDKLKVLLYLLALAKQNVVVKGEFASGKNTIVDSVLELFPKEYVMSISSYTQKILRWLETDEIKILYLKELPPEVLNKAGQLKDFTFDLKLAMSDKVLEIWYVDRVDGELETQKREIRVDTVIQTTPSLDMPEDYKSRCWILSTDPSEEQTEEVLLFKAKMRKFIDEEDQMLSLEELQKISAFLFNISVPVYIPYAETIAKSVKLKNTKMRREIDRLFDLISVIAKVKFPERLYKYKDKFIIVAQIEDFLLSRQLFEEYMQLSVRDMEKRFTIAIEAFNKIARERGQVTVSEFAKEMNLTKKKAKELLEILCDKGLIEKIPDTTGIYSSSTIEIDLSIFREVDEKELEKEMSEWLSKYKIEKATLDEFFS